jgi:hypothetical protein
MKTRTPLVDQFGNINGQVLDDIYIPVLAPEGETLAGRVLVFEILDRNIRKRLVDLPGQPGSLLIDIPAATLSTLPEYSDFALVDQTGPARRVRWSGKLRRYK